jgi:hypothetical protein
VVNYFAEKKRREEKNMKKLNSLILGVLLLTSVIAFMPMPTKAMFYPEMFISPANPVFYTPCVVSTEFDISVKIWNQIEETGYGIYAFEFWLYWPNSTEWVPGGEGDVMQPMVDFVKMEVKPPWPEGQYFIITEELNMTHPVDKSFTVYDPWSEEEHLVHTYWNYYHLAITALDKAPPLEDVKIPVVDFTFHIADEPLARNPPSDYFNWFIPFVLDGVKMTDFDAYGRPTPVPYLTENGVVDLVPLQPQMWLNGEKGYDEDKDTDVDFDYVVRWTNCTWFTIEVEGRRFGKMYGFEFYLTFNATLLNTDLQHIHIKDTVPPPYETLVQEVIPTGNPWESLWQVHIAVMRPCNKPPICGAGPLVNIDFHTKCPTLYQEDWLHKPGVYTLPTIVESSITLAGAKIYSKYYKPTCNTYMPRTYGYGWLPGDYPLLVGKKQLSAAITGSDKVKYYNFVKYHFIPLKADVDQSGHVDLIDLSAVAKQYGKGPSDNEYAAAFAKLETKYGGDTAVDLMDVVYIAKYFCKDFKTVLKWPIDPYTGLVYDP